MDRRHRLYTFIRHLSAQSVVAPKQTFLVCFDCESTEYRGHRQNMAMTDLVALMMFLTLSATQPPPQKCCIADRFSATMVDLTTINGNEFRLMNQEFDFVAGKQALVSFTQNPNTGVSNYTSRTVYDFNKGKEYYLPVNEPSKCYVKDWAVRPVNCIPENAQYLGSTYLGSLSTLPYDGWRFKLPGSNVTISIGVSTKDCVPIAEGVLVSDNPEDQMIFLFTSFEPRTRNPDWFDLPSICNQ